MALPGFVGSPAHCWSHFFLFPPLPSSIGGHTIPDVRQVSLELLVERFGPVWDVCKKYGVTFDLECHPSERAMGDIESASDYINLMDKAGYERRRRLQPRRLAHGMAGRVGGAVHPRVRRAHPLRPHQGRAGESASTRRAGLLGGHRPMGHPLNGWNFVTAGTARDANSVEEIFIELNRVGFDGAVSIEWEDNDAEQHAGAKAALANCPPGRPARPAACGTTRCSKHKSQRREINCKPAIFLGVAAFFLSVKPCRRVVPRLKSTA